MSTFSTVSGLVAGVVLASTGCLSSYGGSAPQDDLGPSGISDLAFDDSTSDLPPSLPPPPADLADTVRVDQFTSTGTVGLALSETTATMSMNASSSVTLMVSGNGATGTATLGMANAPTGMTAVFAPPTVTLGAAAVPVTMTVTTSSMMDPATSVAATVQATVGSTVSSTTFGITVMPEVMIYVSAGLGTGASTTAFGETTIPMKLIGTGTKITFVNNDTIAHRIHADGTGGLMHEPNNMAPNGGTYTQMITGSGPIGFYCHIHGTKQPGKLMVQ